MSLHRFDNQTFYPRRADSAPSYIGEGDGTGFNINIAWQTGKVADEEVRQNNEVTELGSPEYVYAFDKLILPIAREF